jgi:hypothetical protein
VCFGVCFVLTALAMHGRAQASWHSQMLRKVLQSQLAVWRTAIGRANSAKVLPSAKQLACRDVAQTQRMGRAGT